METVKRRQQHFLQIFRLAVSIPIVLPVLAACSGMSPLPHEVALTSLSSANAGVEWGARSPGFAVQAHDYDGGNVEFSWPQGRVHERLVPCLQQLTQRIRFPDPAAAPAPIRGQVDACIEAAGVAAPVVRELPRAEAYTLAIQVSTDDRQIAPGAMPVSGGARYLGATEVLRRQGAEIAAITVDVDQCRDAASKYGVIALLGPTNMPQGLGLVSQYQTIEPFVDRLNACLQKLGYEVTATPQRGS